MAATTGQLGLVTPTQGDLSGVWGDTVNNGITEYTNIAIAGTLTLTGDGAVTLQNTTGNNTTSNITSTLTGAGTVTAQFAIVKVTGTLTTAKIITAPSYSKTYVVVNAATGSTVSFIRSGQTPAISIAVGETAFVYYNGTDYVKLTGTATAGAAGGSTTQVQYNSSGVLAGSANMTFDGTTLTAGGFTTSGTTSTAGLTASGTVTISGGTANGVTYLNGSKVLTSGSALTFDGTNIAAAGLATFGSAVIGLSAANTDFRVVRTLGNPTFYAGVKQSGQGAYFLGNKSDTLVIDSDPTNETAGSNIAFNVDGSEKARFDASGNLGIGTSSPQAKLVVSNAGAAGYEITPTGGVGGGATIATYNRSTSAYTSLTTYASAITWYNGSTRAMDLDTSGNLGIGTTSPNGKLSLLGAFGTTQTAGLTINSTGNTTGLLAPIAFYLQSSSWGTVHQATITAQQVSGTDGGANLVFRTSSTGQFAPTEYFRIASTGAFGLSGANYGTSGQVLTSGGSGAAPTWTTVSGGGGSPATPTVAGTVFGSMTASGASPYLTALGYNAGAATTGARNVFVGQKAGEANVTGPDNVAIGFEALRNYTEANGGNIAIGSYALTTATSGSSYYNVAIGYEAMNLNTSGYNNVAMGWRALKSNTSGRYSTAVGYQALYQLQTGNDGSTAVGSNAGSAITTGIYNVMVGGSALATVTTGSYNTAMGYNALGSTATTSSSNTAFGYNALAAGGVKDGNVAIGRDAMVATTGGGNNVAVGREALTQNTTSANNVSIGYRSLFSVTTASGNHVAVGHEALYSATDNSNVAVGYRAGYGVTSGHNNVLIGTQAGNVSVILAGGAQNVVIGAEARTNTTGAYNEIVIGQTCNGIGNDYVTLGKLNNRVYNHYDTNATWIQASDVRLKKDIEDDSLGLSFINKLRPVKYRWKATNELEQDNPQYSEVNNKNTTAVMHGLIAQEVKAVLDEEGIDTFGGWHIESNGIQGVSREMFITPLINAIQELTAQIETLKAEVAALKGNV